MESGLLPRKEPLSEISAKNMGLGVVGKLSQCGDPIHGALQNYRICVNYISPGASLYLIDGSNMNSDKL